MARPPRRNPRTVTVRVPTYRVTNSGAVVHAGSRTKTVRLR